MKVVILGAKGMLGSALVKTFEYHKLTSLDEEDLDITNYEDVSLELLELEPDLIINAAAYTDVDGAEQKEELAMEVNGHAVENLGFVAEKIGAALCHFSTDYVFGEEHLIGYRESDTPSSPLNMYGKSKLLGERLLSKIEGLQYFLIRTSWLYGTGGKNFVDTILAHTEEKDKVSVINDQFGRPTFTKDLAEKTKEIVMHSRPGIYHVTNFVQGGKISWFDFAKHIADIKKLEAHIVPVSSKEFPRLAKRPKYSILLSTKLPPLRSWEQALKEYLGDVNPREQGRYNRFKLYES